MFIAALPGTGQHVPAGQRASEGVGGGMATWHDQFNLDGAACWCQENREAHSFGGGEGLEAEIEAAEQTRNTALRVFRAFFILNN